MLNGLEKNKAIYLGIGTNLGDRLANIKQVIHYLIEEGVRVVQTASIYETEALGFSSDNSFYNTVFEVKSNLGPLELLNVTQLIERKIGRQKKTVLAYEDRIIDIDILLFKEEVFNSKTLTIPHPKMLTRKFVLHPLNDTDYTLESTYIDEKEPIIVHKPLLVS